jgi:hypothetical protein
MAKASELAKDQIGRVDEKDKGKKVSGQNERGTNDQSRRVPKRRDERDSVTAATAKATEAPPKAKPKAAAVKLHRLQMIPRSTGSAALSKYQAQLRGGATTTTTANNSTITPAIRLVPVLVLRCCASFNNEDWRHLLKEKQLSPTIASGSSNFRRSFQPNTSRTDL